MTAPVAIDSSNTIRLWLLLGRNSATVGPGPSHSMSRMPPVPAGFSWLQTEQRTAFQAYVRIRRESSSFGS